MAKENNNSITLTDVISTAIKVPGVKVNREAFLREQFKKEDEAVINTIVEAGPVVAGRSRKELKNMASKVLTVRTAASTGASFLAGLPGGLTMGIAIPADITQFYAIALRMAQELAYLYGEKDLWDGEKLDDERVMNQLILYCGVMLGAAGAGQAVRVMASSLAKQVAKKLPQKALTKGFIYPIVKSVAKFFGVSMTKKVFAQGISKAVPFIGGVVSGGITFATMKPMGNRLIDALDEAHFDYTEVEFEADWNDIVEICEASDDDAPDTVSDDDTMAKNDDPQEMMNKIAQAKQMLDSGIITEEEFISIKKRIIESV